jgi:tetratricopeptide (TPR) repeat protein
MSTKPVIFISYSHKDEPDLYMEPAGFRWLSYVKSFLDPAEAHGRMELWDDRRIDGGGDWRKEIEEALEHCAVCIFLVSRHSLSSRFILDVEMKRMLERHHAKGAHLYPIVITSTDLGVAPWLLKLNLKPTNGTALELYETALRNKVMADLASEIRTIVERAAARPPVDTGAPLENVQPPLVHTTGLPETDYVRLVGRDAILKRLDEAWTDRAINIISLIAEGGAGKSALVNEWLIRLQADQYRSAEAVIGWSFYSQGSKERATSAEQFLDWTLEKLGIRIDTTSASAKGDAIAEAIGKRRALLILDGVEPLQHGLGRQQGELKDVGLRTLLRRFATMPPTEGHGLVVLTSRLVINDIARWRGGAAPVIDVEELSEEAGAQLLRDNGVKGTITDLKAAAQAFGGHPLALGLLASLLKETQYGDVRRRDHIRPYLADSENPRHDHARRVMESYEKEWLASRPMEHAIMYIVGLFDRPASGDCLRALRKTPAIEGLTEALVDLDEDGWRRAVARLREVRLLSPQDPSAPEAVDAHPLVREYFGVRLEQTNRSAWQAAHGRLYEHLRDTTEEGETPTLATLTPLYQGVAHGCRAGRHEEALEEVYRDRICRLAAGGSMEFYATRKLGAFGTDLAALSWFFDRPYETPAATLTAGHQAWVLNLAALRLRVQGRLIEALPAQTAGLRMNEAAKHWRNAGIAASNLSETRLTVGEVAAAVATAQQAIAHADKTNDKFWMMACRVVYAHAHHAAGRYDEAARLFADAEHGQKERQRDFPLLYSLQGYLYCDLLMSKGDYAAVIDRATKTIIIARTNNWLLDIALDTLTIGRAHLALALAPQMDAASPGGRRDDVRIARTRLDEAVDGLRASGTFDYIPRGVLPRAAFCRSVGDWGAAVRNLNEVEEIAEPGPMKLHLCDMALERARLAFAHMEAFAPLNGLIDGGPPKPKKPGKAERDSLRDEAAKQLVIAADYIEKCGYHRRDDQLAELQAVLKGERTFADLPPWV